MLRILCLYLSLLVSFTCFSQSRIQFGLKAGGNYSMFFGTGEERYLNLPEVEYEPKLGAHFGILAYYDLDNLHNNIFNSFQAELYYSMEGAKSEDSTFSLNYLRFIPIALTTHINKFNFIVGPQLGFLLSAISEAKSGVSADSKDNLKKTDFSVVAGIGFNITQQANLELRSNYSFIKLGGPHLDYRPFTFQFGLSYIFGKE